MMYDTMYMGGVLVHHGIHGMQWGKRNGPPYPLKPSAHSKAEKVFISGSSKTQFKDSPYYRKKLSRKLRADIKKEMRNKSTILVGDAPGIDRQVQDYLKKKRYKNVEVYSPGKEARYLADKNWKNTTVDVPDAEPGSPEWLAAKDKVMQKNASKGIAVILPNGSGATKNNIDRLIKDNKDVKIYQLSDKSKRKDIELKVEDYIKNRTIEKKREKQEKEYEQSSKIINDKKNNVNINSKEFNNWLKKNNINLSKDEEKDYKKRELIPRYLSETDNEYNKLVDKNAKLGYKLYFK